MRAAYVNGHRLFKRLLVDLVPRKSPDVSARLAKEEIDALAAVMKEVRAYLMLLEPFLHIRRFFFPPAPEAGS